MAILILTRLDLADFKDSEDKRFWIIKQMHIIFARQNELSASMLKNIIMPIKDRFANWLQHGMEYKNQTKTGLVSISSHAEIQWAYKACHRAH